jgi:DNA-binding transcriptional regulator GbsR (MarR family)
MTKRSPPSLPHQPLLDFVEEVGLSPEPPGMPRMAKRILAYLLICEPETQTLDDLAKALKASKASISTMTRMMCYAGIVEKVAFSGERKEFFRANTRDLSDVFQKQMMHLATFRKLMEKGLGLVQKFSSSDTQRLENMCQFYSWLENQFPSFISSWEKEQKKIGKKS